MKKIIPLLILLLVSLLLLSGCTEPPQPPPLPSTCTENWRCNAWGECIEGQQKRSCTDLNDCGTVVNKPIEQQSCEVAGKLPYSFFAVHLEPQTANSNTFKTLKEFVETADSYNVKLTLMFTPQWAEMVLADNKKLALVRQWEAAGHEIAAHHHGPSHPGTWDGYTNAENWQELREKFGKAEQYLGDMNDYLEILEKLPRGGRIFSGTLTDKCTDTPPGVIYDAAGPFIEGKTPEGRTTIIRTHLFNNVLTYKLYIKALRIDESTLREIKEQYNSLKEKEIMGVATHASNFAGKDKELILSWFEFLHNKNPNGRYSLTVTDLMENHILKNNELPIKECPTPKCDDEVGRWLGEGNC